MQQQKNITSVIDLQQLKTRLGQLDTQQAGDDFIAQQSVVAKGQAAVLLPLLQVASEWHLLFIRRAAIAGDIHSAQVAFPGGVAGHDEDVVSNALRETQEEVGVAPADINLLGVLPRFMSVSKYIVSPVVGILPWPYTLTLQASEVSRAFTIPLTWLADPANYRIENRFIEQFNMHSDIIYYQEYDNEVLWGLTARIVHAFLELLSISDGCD